MTVDKLMFSNTWTIPKYIDNSTLGEKQTKFCCLLRKIQDKYVLAKMFRNLYLPTAHVENPVHHQKYVKTVIYFEFLPAKNLLFDLTNTDILIEAMTFKCCRLNYP